MSKNIYCSERKKIASPLSFKQRSLWESFWFYAAELDSSQEQLEWLKILHTKKTKVVVKWPQDSEKVSENFLERWCIEVIIYDWSVWWAFNLCLPGS